MAAVRANAGGFDASSAGGSAARDGFRKKFRAADIREVSNAGDLVVKLTGPWVKQ
jgi:hypothetical protein